MTTIHIPPEAVKAAQRALITRQGTEAAIRAALVAWPGMNHDSQAWRGYGGEVLILPLPQDKSDA